MKQVLAYFCRKLAEARRGVNVKERIGNFSIALTINVQSNHFKTTEDVYRFRLIDTFFVISPPQAVP